MDIQNNFLSSDDVVWGAEPAGLGSFGKRFTNGNGFQNLNGEWIEGEPATLNADLATIAGVTNYFTPVNSMEELA